MLREQKDCWKRRNATVQWEITSLRTIKWPKSIVKVRICVCLCDHTSVRLAFRGDEHLGFENNDESASKTWKYEPFLCISIHTFKHESRKFGTHCIAIFLGIQSKTLMSVGFFADHEYNTKYFYVVLYWLFDNWICWIAIPFRNKHRKNFPMGLKYL